MIEIKDLKVGTHYWVRMTNRRYPAQKYDAEVMRWEGGDFRGGSFSIIASDECFFVDEYHFEIISEIIPPEGL